MLGFMVETVVGVFNTAVMLLFVFPLAALAGVTMMVNAIHVWLGVAGICLIGGVVTWRWLRARHEVRDTLRLFALTCYGGAVVFFSVAVGFAYHYCYQPRPDGFCSFAGYPFLSFSAAFLVVGLLARFRAWRLGRHKADAHSWT
jgi:hypothetical protein